MVSRIPTNARTRRRTPALFVSRTEPIFRAGRWLLMTDANTRLKRREQQAAEIEANQADLRTSIAESQRLVGEADHIIRRHRQECEADDAAASEALRRSG